MGQPDRAHVYFGDAVSPRTWDDTWLSEGNAHHYQLDLPDHGPERVAGSGTQSGEGDLDEPVDRGLGRQSTGGGEGVPAVARENADRNAQGPSTMRAV
jgi:hypothetical protein